MSRQGSTSSLDIDGCHSILGGCSDRLRSCGCAIASPATLVLPSPCSIWTVALIHILPRIDALFAQKRKIETWLIGCCDPVDTAQREISLSQFSTRLANVSLDATFCYIQGHLIRKAWVSSGPLAAWVCLSERASEHLTGCPPQDQQGCFLIAQLLLLLCCC